MSPDTAAAEPVSTPACSSPLFQSPHYRGQQAFQLPSTFVLTSPAVGVESLFRKSAGLNITFSASE